jgi:HEAT repeat protein
VFLAHAKPRHPAIIRKLIEQLDHDSTLLRQTTVRVLGEIGPPAAKALPKLYEIALDPSTPQELRQGAKATIKSIGNVKQPDGGGAKQ